jgi:SAM-dependent methyltransferase
LSKTYRTLQHWNHWLTQFLGKCVLEAEQKTLTRIYAEYYGKYAVLIGVPHQYSLLTSNVMSNHVMISPLINKHAHIESIESDFYELPIVPGSIDLVVLPHTLEFVDNPHRLLLEACKIVKPEGDIIILGFNPFSFWGLKKYLTKNKNNPWNGNSIRMNQVIQWLKLADFQIIQEQFSFFRPPISQEKFFRKLQFFEWLGRKFFMPFGGIYILTAKAKITPLTPIKLLWKQKLSPLSATFSGPTMRDRQ